MTIESTKTKDVYNGNGTTTVFPVPFRYSSTETIVMVLTDADGTSSAITGNYKISVNARGDTELRYPVAGKPIPAGTSLTIYRKTPLTQIVDLIYGGAFSPDVLEHDGFDRIVMQMQELQEEVDRSFKVSISNTDAPPTADEYLAEVGAQVAQAESAATAAANSAGDAANSANTAAQTVQTATAGAVAAAAGHAASAAESADAAAQSAADAAEFVPDALIARVAAVEVKTAPATETTQGIIALATSAEASAGTNDTKAMTPLKTKTVIGVLAAQKINYMDFTQSFTTPGWVKLPNGLILQWVNAPSAAPGVTTVYFPITFPTGVLQVICSGQHSSGNTQANITIHYTSTNSLVAVGCFTAMSGVAPAIAAAGVMQVKVFAIGY